MTASPRRRRRAAWGAVVGVAIGLAAVVGIGNAGRVAILNTTDGDLQIDSTPADRFPDTAITAVAVADDEGWLASLALLVEAPGDEQGGTIVVVPVNADTTNGFGDQRRPLDAVAFAADAPLLSTPVAADADTGSTTVLGGGAVRKAVGERLADELPVMLGVSIDEVVVLGAAEFAVQLAGLGASPATAELLTARPPAPILAAFPGQVEAWRTLASTARTADASSWTALFAGDVAVAALTPQLPDVSVPLEGIDVAFLDRAEIVTLFAHIAPARVAAPNAGLNFRIVSAFGDDQLAGVTRYDVAYLATALLLDAGHNVLSVDTSAAAAIAATVVEVDDDAALAATAAFGALFGPVDVKTAERRIVGTDVIVTLGTDFLASATSALQPPVEAAPAGSAPADITSTTEEASDG